MENPTSWSGCQFQQKYCVAHTYAHTHELSNTIYGYACLHRAKSYYIEMRLMHSMHFFLAFSFSFFLRHNNWAEVHHWRSFEISFTWLSHHSLCLCLPYLPFWKRKHLVERESEQKGKDLNENPWNFNEFETRKCSPVCNCEEE